MELLDTTATVETPERVRFRYRLAGPGQRAAAWGVDALVQLAILTVIAVGFGLLSAIPGLDGVGTGLILLGVFAVQWLYGAVFETLLDGRTPGKMLVELRVVRVDGSPARLPDFLLRNLLRSADFLPMGFGLGVLVMTLDRRMRRIGDLVAGTVVVAEDKAAVLGGLRIRPPVTEEERQSLPARVDLRAEELRVIEDFLRRRDRLSDERAEELARLFGPELSERSGLQAPTWERVLTLAYARATGKDREPDAAGGPVGADREGFVEPRRARWARLDRLVSRGPAGPGEWSELAFGYAALCADLARARTRGLPSDVQGYLDDLAGRAHNLLYSVRPTGLGRSLLRDALVGFPRELRSQWRFFALASALFYGPFLVGALGGLGDPAFASRVLPEEQLELMEQMYSGEDLARGFGGDATMAGFYVFNNVGIAFRCFTTGALAGLGSVFYLVYNGLMIGTVFGYLGAAGLGGNLLEFTSGHSAWELTGVCVAGAAGLRLGWALVVTDGLTRATSLRRAAPSLYRLVLGTTVLLLVAAAIEGFWSAGPVPRAGKYLFGVVQIGVVGSWLWFGGRREALR